MQTDYRTITKAIDATSSITFIATNSRTIETAWSYSFQSTNRSTDEATFPATV
jgi:hypothetical protein